MSNYFPAMTHESRFFSDLHRYRRNCPYFGFITLSAAYSENLWIRTTLGRSIRNHVGTTVEQCSP